MGIGLCDVLSCYVGQGVLWVGFIELLLIDQQVFLLLLEKLHVK